MANIKKADIFELMLTGKEIIEYPGSRLNSYKKTYSIDNKTIHFKTFDSLKNAGIIVFHGYINRTLLGVPRVYRLINK